MYSAIEQVQQEMSIQFESQVILDSGLITIEGLEIEDPELYEIISDQKVAARPGFVKRGLKVGAIVLRDAVIGKKMDYIRGEFEKFCFDLEKTHGEKGMYEEIEKEIDVERINGTIRKISNDLNAIRGIKAKLIGIGKISESIKIDLKSLKTTIRDSLMELQGSLRSS